jgi:hypothetical protein
MLILPALLLWLLPGTSEHGATMWGCALAGIIGGAFAMYAVMGRSPSGWLNRSAPRPTAPRPNPSPDE